jgi:predicted dehydrogenase
VAGQRDMWRMGMLAGTGTGRKRIMPALRGSDRCRVTVVQGRDPARLNEIERSDAAVRLVADTGAFVARSELYDVVYIGSPPFLRSEHIAVAAKLAKPILSEKPLATTHTQLAEIQAMVTAAGVPLCVAHHVRHQPAVTEIKQLIDGGVLGSVRDVRLQWDFTMDLHGHNAAWKLQPALAGSSSMFDSGVHAVDLAVHLFGAPGRVSAVGQRRRTPEFMDSVTAILDYGTHAVTVATSQAADPHANDLVVTGSEGSLHAPSLLGEVSAAALLLTRGRHTEERRYPAVNLYRAMVHDFCGWLEGAPSAGTTMSDAVATSNVLFAIEAAIASGRTVQVDADDPGGA